MPILRTAAVLLLLLLLLLPLPAFAAPVIGSVTRVKGDCEATGEGTTRALAAGAPVHLDETVATGDGARLALTFEDGTVLTLGEKARVTIDRFVYRPRGLGNAFRATTIGAFRFVSGNVGKTAASSVAVTTPVATIAIRGTDFWGGPIDGVYGVFLAEGVVTVSAGGRGAVLDQPGEGVTITPLPRPRGAAEEGGLVAGAVAGTVTVWPQDRVARAIATVTFD